MNCEPNLRKRCRCNCGYRCGGPGRCKLDVSECLQQTDGKHFVRDCEHDFGGTLILTNYGGSVACQKCGELAETHDMMVGP